LKNGWRETRNGDFFCSVPEGMGEDVATVECPNFLVVCTLKKALAPGRVVQQVSDRAYAVLTGYGLNAANAWL
jgi:hypothetical protein